MNLNSFHCLQKRLANNDCPGLNPAHLLFLYGLLAKNGFYIIKWLKKSKEDYFVARKKYMNFIWQFLKVLKIELPYDPAIPLLGIYPRELETYAHTKTCA